MKRPLLTGALLLLLASAGCRGMETGNEPIHPNPNMDVQPRYNAQEESEFFDNEMTMRPPVPGTVAKGFLREDTRLYTGQTESGQFVDEVPVPVTQALLERGRERYNIFCSVCHGQAGFGQGVIMTGDYGYTPAPSYHTGTLRDTVDGYLYEVITNGVRNMPGYAQQIPVADRWAIVAYIRALQRSQNARRENVPPSVLARIEQTGSANMNAARNPAAPGGAGGGNATGGNATGGNATGGNASADTASGGNATGGSAPADTAAQQPATDAGSSADAGSTVAGSDTAGAATASADTAAAGGEAGMDTTSAATTIAENAGAADTASAVDTASAGGTAGAGEGAAGDAAGTTGVASSEGGGFFGSVASIVLLVVLPIAALGVMLVVAFRKDHGH